jgi:hypothetical protein
MFIQRSDALVLNSVTDNIIVGNQFEFAPTRSIVEFGIVASATGLEVDILIGARAVVTRLIPSLANRFALYPDDYTIKAPAMAGERVIIRARNTTGGTLTLFTSVKYNPR